MPSPTPEFERQYNAAHDLLSLNLAAGRTDKIAYLDDHRSLTYGQLAARADAFGQALLDRGIRPEERILLCMLDTVDWPVAFLGAIKVGIVPIAVNTLLKPQDYQFMLADSRASLAFVSAPLMPAFEGLGAASDRLQEIIEVAVNPGPDEGAPYFVPGDLNATPREPAATCCDEPAFWLYSSGSTGQPKGTVHVQTSIMNTARLYGGPVLGIKEDDVVFSAAKLFFAYGLGNALSFPLAVGATTVLMPERPTPDSVFARLTGDHKPTIFYGVPTLFAAMLASDRFPDKSALHLRVATSAGEPLPEEIGKRFSERTGIEILDGIGSTEMLHIFLSNSPGKVRYGTTGQPVPGYELKLSDENGELVADGEIGDLYIKGPTTAAMYWNQRDKTRDTFQGVWTRSGDKYVRDAQGYYTYAGRSDDMLKVSGQYVSPFEVESALASHEAVLEAAVVGAPDEDDLIKPKAYVVLHEPAGSGQDLVDALKAHVKDQLAPFKYPRWVQFVDELPKTATGKIQRFKLRG